VITAVGLTVHPLSNLLINAEADKSSSGSAVAGSVIAGLVVAGSAVTGGDIIGGGGGKRLVSTSETTVRGGDGGGGGGGGDGAVTVAGSGFSQTGPAADLLAGTVVSLVCSPLGGTGGGFCLPVAVVPCPVAVDVLTGGVGAPLLAPPPVPENVCKTDAGTGVCSCCCGGR